VQYVESDGGWRSIGMNSRIEEASTRMLELLVSLAKAESATPAATDGATATSGSPATPGGGTGRGRPRRMGRGLREIKPWNYREAEARDRFRRNREARGGVTDRVNEVAAVLAAARSGTLAQMVADPPRDGSPLPQGGDVRLGADSRRIVIAEEDFTDAFIENHGVAEPW
jgi:hypothetical protein